MEKRLQIDHFLEKRLQDVAFGSQVGVSSCDPRGICELLNIIAYQEGRHVKWDAEKHEVV